MTASPTSPSANASTPQHGYHVQELHLYNWGAFAGRHQARLDNGNTAIIGPTGSGKTTLMDALMTLLCQNPRYNLASTGGHESDRDLVSYVRGATGPGHAGPDSEHLARSGRCVTAIAARLVRGGNDDNHTKHSTAASPSVLLGGLFWFDGSSSSASDLQKRWFFAQGAGHDMDIWLEEHHSGGARALGRLEKNTDRLQIFNSKSAYLARLQRFFEVGPNAFTLLNRAAGLKQLNSIDEIFRELVLDDESAFDDALQVVSSFDELASIHAELELANRQYLALLPLRELAEKERQQQRQLQELHTLQTALPAWFAHQGQQLWQQRSAQLDAQLKPLQAQLTEAQSALGQARAEEQLHLEAYLRTGGSDIQSLQDSIAALGQVLSQRQKMLADYQKLARNLALAWPADGLCNAALLSTHQSQAVSALQQLNAQQEAQKAATEEAVTQERNAHAQLERLKAERQTVQQRPGSNVPPEFQQFRAALAEQLQLSPEALPFVAELVEVRKDQAAWRGAIERALGSQRLRILVPASAMRAALAWVNQRQHRLHVRLLEVQEQPVVTFWPDGFCQKLNLKPQPYQNALRKLLSELDRHCVASAEALHQTPHAMTAQGLMSGKALHFDKQDQKRLDQDWMTGFDNTDLLTQLAQHITQAQEHWQTLVQQKQAALQAADSADNQRRLWHSLQTLRFDELDVASIQTQRQQQQQRLEALLAPQSDTAQAQKRWEAATAHREQVDALVRQSLQQQSTLQKDQAQATKKQADYQTRLASLSAPSTLPDLPTQAQRLSLTLPVLDCEQLDRQELQVREALGIKLEKQTKQHNQLQNDITRQMGKAQKEDRGALVEQTEDLIALPHYLERLRVLEQEALPDKRQRFQDYLNTASEQGVSTLLNGIEAQVAEITERLDALNQTLQRVDFQPGRYLQLAPQTVVHQSLQTLNQAMAQLRVERLRDDNGHSHYVALRAMVELLREHANNRRTKAAQALLDARYRLQFAVHVLDRASGQVLERRTGSQGGSGGEKEIIASYVLTASLSYALCPPGRQHPLFASIVLDEAFSKSSQAVAARIIQALHEFGLHALFVTPNKELRLLRDHTRSAVVVHRRGAQASLTCLSWQELEAHARQRQADPAGEVPPA
ncbi:MAG: ATP-binding protein [Giesbergeria sp.]|uniref:ATP-binding protein n=1 Tax=Giesbergeria sp. TaxID=2818473 RepID=UPI00262EDBB2|nr:ATP-binding protein [Giesbergeria sp.]MDD2609021.1 ATP-binding protein [Giesbergeria sp.]